ncbi:MAG: hypothetical protein D6723_16830 [Acidobacteria bacterium]|nr:MAG: hypothetical protein D6723_16830 [Acidobacteriota bacterium]
MVAESPMNDFEKVAHGLASHTAGMKRARRRIFAFSAPLRWIFEGGRGKRAPGPGISPLASLPLLDGGSSGDIYWLEI